LLSRSTTRFRLSPTLTPTALANCSTLRIGFVTVLRARIVGAVAVVALLAIFALDRNMAVLLMTGSVRRWV
jgi:hypothetical protein